MKKYIIGGLIAAAIIIYLVYANTKSAPVATTMPPSVTSTPSENDQGNSTTTMGAGTNTNTGISIGSSSMPGMTMGQYKDGTYTGPVENAFYGNIQVAVTISGGMITAVNVPIFPNAPGHTTDVTNSTIPALKQEALTAQSANVNVVSGATQDSEAFQQSLSAALAQAT
jgi:uncharacterized protein with FMN-binding domain